MTASEGTRHDQVQRHESSRDLTPQSPDKPKNLALRLTLLGVVLAAALACVQLTPLKAWLQDSGHVREAVRSLGLWAYPICVVATTLLVAIGVPRLLLCLVGSMVLGFWAGLLVNQIGTLIGYYAVFLFVRWGGRGFVLHRWPQLRKWSDLLKSQGIAGVILARQLPVHGTLINLCLGLATVKHRHFLIGSAVGTIPEAIPLALVGAGFVKTDPKSLSGYIALAVLAFAVVWISARYVLNRVKSIQVKSDMIADAIVERD